MSEEIKAIEAEMDRAVDALRTAGSRTPINDWCEANPNKALALLRVSRGAE